MSALILQFEQLLGWREQHSALEGSFESLNPRPAV